MGPALPAYYPACGAGLVLPHPCQATTCFALHLLVTQKASSPSVVGRALPLGAGTGHQPLPTLTWLLAAAQTADICMCFSGKCRPLAVSGPPTHSWPSLAAWSTGLNMASGGYTTCYSHQNGPRQQSPRTITKASGSCTHA